MSKWRESRWKFSHRAARPWFGHLVGKKPVMYVLGSETFPTSWSHQARCAAARRRLWNKGVNA